MIIAQRQAIFWVLAFLGILAIVFVFKSVLLPFVLGMTVAYFLNPVVKRLCGFGLSRGMAAVIILAVFLSVLITLLAMIVPVLYREILQFAQDLPSYIDRMKDWSQPFIDKTMAMIGRRNQNELKEMIGQQAGPALNMVGTMISGIAVGSQAVLQIISIAVIMPIVAYFAMKEWEIITAKIHSLLPLHSRDRIVMLLRQIDRKLSGFVRGQLSVMVVLALAYAIALSLAGLKYGFLIGIASGVLSIIPMVGSAMGFVISIIVAWLQSDGEWSYMLIIAGLFLTGQFIEGNFLTPKLVGDSVGLHPLWVFFALMAGGSLFGILGMLLAMPVAAVASVLISFAISQYKASPYYSGSDVKIIMTPEDEPFSLIGIDNDATRPADSV